MNKVTQAELDWFAEGELNADERAELFARLDAEPDGWKRCTMALLEHRALAASLNSIQKQPISPDKSERVMAPVSVASRTVGSPKWVNRAIAATVACLLFVTGFWFAGIPSHSVVWQPTELDVQHPLIEKFDSNRIDMMLAVNQAVSRVGVNDRQLIALVTMETDNDLFLLPMIESETLNQKINDLPEPQIPNHLSRELARSGFEVQPHRQFLSVRHEDGTNEVLPMNMLDCRYVGKPVF